MSKLILEGEKMGAWAEHGDVLIYRLFERTRWKEGGSGGVRRGG